MCAVRRDEKVLFNLFLSPIPNSKVRKRELPVAKALFKKLKKTKIGLCLSIIPYTFGR